MTAVRAAPLRGGLALLLLLVGPAAVAAFSAPRRGTPRPRRGATARFSAVLEDPAVLADAAAAPAAWECDADANCDLVPACDETACRTTLDVRIHGTWYDLSGWRKAHPAGAHW